MADDNRNSNRRQVIRDHVLALTGYEYWNEKETLVDICVEYIPEKVECGDGVVIILILVRGGFLNLNNYNEGDIFMTQEDTRAGLWVIGLSDRDKCICCRINEDGRITSIRTAGRSNLQHDLSADIGRLEQLQELAISGCRSLPVEALQNLPNLESLDLLGCPDLLQNFPVEMDLNLKDVALAFCELQSSSSPILQWIATKLPNLTHLRFLGLDASCTSNCIVPFLRAADLCFHDKLKFLSMGYCCRDGKGDQILEALLLEILPERLPSVSDLKFYCNGVKSIRPIIGRIQSDEAFSISKSLRRLDLHGNSFVAKIKEGDVAEKSALLSLLNTYNKVYTYNKVSNIGGVINSQSSCSFISNMVDTARRVTLDGKDAADIGYVLSINEAGRYLLEEGNNDSGDHHRQRPIPLSLWPLVLEKSYKRTDTPNYTGAYYLLRNGPALASCNFENYQRKESSLMKKASLNKRKRDSDNEVGSISFKKYFRSFFEGICIYK